MLVLGVQTMTKPREVEGDIKNPEDVQTGEQAWSLLLDLDDIRWLSNRDKAGIREFVEGAAERIKQSYKAPCSWWGNLWNREGCR